MVDGVDGGDRVRVLLAMLVGLAQVAGPWLCCCVTCCAVVASTPSPAPAETCPHCRKKAPEPPAKPALPEPCPCGGKMVPPAPPAKPDLAATVIHDPPAGFNPFVGPAVVVLLPPTGVSELPFLPPGTRQFVHHVLRC